MINHVDVNKLIDEGIIDDHPDVNLVNQTLLNLVNAGLLKKEDKERYVFKEQVTWEVVYETLLYSERRYLHDIVASHIEKHNAENLGSCAARLVYHYENSDNKKKIIFFSALAGDYAYSLFAIDDALSFYKKARSILVSKKNYPTIDLCLLLEHEADIMEAVSDFSESIELYKESLNILDVDIKSKRTFLPWKNDIKKKKAQIYHKIAVAYERSLDYDKSIYYLDKSSDSLPPRPGLLVAKVNATRGVVYFRRMEFDDALLYAKKSLRNAIQKKSYSDMGYAYNIIANVYKITGQLNASVGHFKHALEKYEKADDINGIAMSCFNLAVALTHLGELDDADIYYEKSLKINKQMQNKLALMQDYFMRANTRMHLKDYENASNYYNNAIDLYEAGLKREDIYGICLARKAEIHSENNNISKAVEYISKSIEILSKLSQSPESLGQARIILVQIKIKQNNYSDAESICIELLDKFREMKAVPYELFSMRLLGMVYRDIAKYSMAKDIMEQAYNLASKMESPYDQKCVTNLIYNIEVMCGDYSSEMLSKVKSLHKVFSERNDYFEVDIANNSIQLIEENGIVNN